MKTSKRKASTRHYSVYVIRLDPGVLEIPKFVRANPDYVKGRPCVYVGMTFHTPRFRLGQHLIGRNAGYPACKLVTDFGIGLMPKIYDKYNAEPMTKSKAVKREVKLAKRLRKLGYAVWQK